MIGVLYESDEWSDYHLAAELEGFGCEVAMIDMQSDGAESQALACDMLVSRVFASAYSRGHATALSRTPALLARAEQAGIRVINPARAHAFETSKARSTSALAQAGVPVPKVYGVFRAAELAQALPACPEQGVAARLGKGAGRGAAVDFGRESSIALEGTASAAALPAIAFPLVAKPDCGGRGGDTFVAHDVAELAAQAKNIAPDLPMLLEEYVAPAHGYLTRIEVIGGKPVLVLKRSVAANGLSGYHQGSTYDFYPECPQVVLDYARKACAALSFEVGSFDVIEACGRIAFIDCNSVSNVSEDCTALFKMDLIREHARYIAGEYQRTGKGDK